MEQSKIANSIIECFVDLNLEVNENFSYDSTDLPKVSFSQDTITVFEGEAINFNVSLDAPSKLGLEELDLIMLNDSTNVDDISSNLRFPRRLKWEIGEITKAFQIPVNTDFVEEDDESLFFGITNLINCVSGNYLQLMVTIVDTTVLNIASISSENGEFIGARNQLESQNYFLQFFVFEGDQLIIKLALPEVNPLPRYFKSSFVLS